MAGDWRDTIVDPETSRYRTLDLDELDQKFRSAGAPPDWRRSDAVLRSSFAQMLDTREPGALWIFGYGSLMWDPGFRWDRVEKARVDGWQRRFCIETTLGRGSIASPGLMAALARGGECEGIAFRVPAEAVPEEAWIVWRREMLVPVYEPSFLHCEVGGERVRALTFVIDPAAEAYRPDLSDTEAARFLCSGAGHFGSALEYLESLIGRLQAMELRDPYIERLGRLAGIGT